MVYVFVKSRNWSCGNYAYLFHKTSTILFEYRQSFREWFDAIGCCCSQNLGSRENLRNSQSRETEEDRQKVGGHCKERHGVDGVEGGILERPEQVVTTHTL